MVDLFSPVKQGILAGLDSIMACDDHDQQFIKGSREAINLETDANFEESVNIKS